MTDPPSAHGPADDLLPLRVLQALTTISFAEQPVVETLHRVLALALEVIPDLTDTSVTLVEDERPWTAAFTGDLAASLDERQYETGFGPCLDAAASGLPIALTLDDPETPYRRFADAARRQGVTHTLSVPLPIAARVVGALNLYSRHGRPFTPLEQRAAETFAGYVAVLAANLTLQQQGLRLAQQLQSALESRAVIEQAKGVLMLRDRCSSDEAFTLLVRESQHRNVKLRTVAEAIVGAVSQDAPGPGRRPLPRASRDGSAPVDGGA